ncbi:hypothetical protein ACFW04_011678 [Cataglyphis niger]
MKSWLYALSKERLAAIAAAYDLDTTGTLDEIRNRMRTYIETHPEEFGETRGPPQTPRIEVHPPSTPTDRTPDNPILNQLRKWGRPFDGRNPVEFLERTDDLLEEYGFSGDQLLRGLSELLRGDPLAWARNNRCDWETWADFCRAFRRRYLPPRYQEDLERQIADRRQHDSERFAPYADAMMTMMRRAGGFTREQRLARIYANMRPEYKRYVKRRDGSSRRRAKSGKHQGTPRTHPPSPPCTTGRNAAGAASSGGIPGLIANAHLDGSARNAAKMAAPHGVRYTPRPHLTLTLHGLPVNALLDSGSELSFINAETAERLRRRGVEPTVTEGQVRMADGTHTTTRGYVQAPLRLQGRTYTHTFAILPAFQEDMLIRQTPHPSCGMAGGLAPSTAEESERLRAFLERELPKFRAVTGPTPLAEHQIRLKNRTPIKQRYRSRNPAMQAIIDAEVDEMERADVIEPSRSAWSSPIVVDAYPLSQVRATLDKLRGARYLTTLDLKNGYWQVPLARESRPITAFTVPGKGLMQFRVMPFGLHSAPATFQRLLDSVIGPALEPNVFVYLDDIIVISRTFERHLELLTEVFRRLRAARLRLNPEKSKQIRQFLGMASWYRRFIENFSTIAAPLTRLTKKNARWTWGEDESAAFKQLKAALTTAPVLACPDFNRRFILQTDASTNGLGAVLTQYHEDGERVIAYASRTLSGAEKNYSATELECLAVVWGVRRMRNYLEGYAFTVITDHQSLRWLQNWREHAATRLPIRITRSRTGNSTDIYFTRSILRTTPRMNSGNCVPRDRRGDILRQYHDAPTAGHGGGSRKPSHESPNDSTGPGCSGTSPGTSDNVRDAWHTSPSNKSRPGRYTRRT